MKSPKEILNKMVDEMPFKIPPHVFPYIEEAMKLYAEESVNEMLAEKDKEIEKLDANNRVIFKSYIKASKQIPKWISVEDSLPTNCTNVLIVHSEGVNEAYYEKERFYTENGSEYNYVTHWMPLPKQP